MSEYISVIHLLLQTLEKPTHRRGMVSEQRMHALLDRISIEVKKNCPSCIDQEK
jgi:hypothetical protein